MAAIPNDPGPSFSESDIESFLLGMMEEGWKVYRREGDYIISIDESREIEISYDRFNLGWDVDHKPLIYEMKTEMADRHGIKSFETLKEAIAKAMQYLDCDIEMPPKSVRLSDSSPASNRVSISKLVADKEVLAIFDPYFCDKGVALLLNLKNLGVCFAKTVRVLGTKRGRVSSEFVNDFESETGVSLDVRFVPSREHRRFLLLSAGQALIIGASLNSISKNEAAHVEDSPDDFAFFEDMWEKSSI